jgi:hypothetical protein
MRMPLTSLLIEGTKFTKKINSTKPPDAGAEIL